MIKNKVNTESENMAGYKGFNKDLTKNDLNKEELKCYNKLMDGIKDAEGKKKEEIAHLMNVVIEADEEEHTDCTRCSKEFIDDYKDKNDENKRIYCDDCLKKMWGGK